MFINFYETILSTDKIIFVKKDSDGVKVILEGGVEANYRSKANSGGTDSAFMELAELLKAKENKEKYGLDGGFT